LIEENVTEIVKKLTDEMPAISGLRIAAEQDGATVYVDAAASVMLDDKILDGGVDAAGNIELALGQQA
jgi:hypothetical protein